MSESKLDIKDIEKDIKDIEKQKILEQTKKELAELRQITGNFNINLEQKSKNENYLIINGVKLNLKLKNFEEYFDVLHYIMKIIKIYKENKNDIKSEKFYVGTNIIGKAIHQMAHNDIMLNKNWAIDKTYLTEETIRKILNIPENKKSKEYVNQLVIFLNNVLETIK